MSISLARYLSDFARLLASLLLASCLSVAAAQAQSGWVQSKGEGFFKLDASHFASRTLVLAGGEELTTNRFTQLGLGFYGEYGPTDRLTLISALPLLRANRFSVTDYAVGPGDLRVGAKYGLLTGGIPVAIEATAGIPTGRANAFADNRELTDNRINLPTGDGEFDVWLSLAASRSLGRAYVSAHAAYNLRTSYEGESFQDLYALGVEFGFRPTAKLLFIGKLRGQLTTGESESPTLSFLRGDATTFTSVSLEAMYALDERFLAVAGVTNTSGALVAASNLYTGTAVSVGVAYELKREAGK